MVTNTGYLVAAILLGSYILSWFGVAKLSNVEQIVIILVLYLERITLSLQVLIGYAVINANKPTKE